MKAESPKRKHFLYHDVSTSTWSMAALSGTYCGELPVAIDVGVLVCYSLWRRGNSATCGPLYRVLEAPSSPG